MPNPLRNPVGQYQAEVLVLAPEENPQDANLLSLVAQLLEMGIAFELDEHWRVPTTPPKDLSAYKSCIFPETARAKYDKDLDAFYRGGGFLTFDKYYPTAAQISKSGFASSTAAYLNAAWGRDLYFYSLASYLYEANVTLNQPDFARVLEGRPSRDMMNEARDRFVAHARRHEGPWRAWGDPVLTDFLSAMAGARILDDAEWMQALDHCLECVCLAADEAFADPIRFQEIPIAGAANNSFDNMGQALMKRGTSSGNETFIKQGVRLGEYFATHVYHDNGATITDRNSALFYSESLFGMPAVAWLARHTRNQTYFKLVARLVQFAIDKTQRADGLWHHWQNVHTGAKGACWSRAQLWPVLAMTESLEAIGPDAKQSEAMRASIQRTFAALEKFQDPPSGGWRLVVDDPDSRIESSGTVGLLYCHDRLREMGVLDERYEEMTARAFLGLKRLYYGGGLAASCRGTACGDLNFYRSRPQGHQTRTHLPAVLARFATEAD